MQDADAIDYETDPRDQLGPLWEFALSFDGYEYATNVGGGEVPGLFGTSVEQDFKNAGRLPPLELGKLRACLYFEQRSWLKWDKFRFGGAEGAPEVSVLRQYGRDRQRLHFIRANSHQPETLDALLNVLEGREIDFLFIDGDHTYDGVRRDFELFAPLVRRGCPIAFHDVLPHPQPDCEVEWFWSEIRSGYRYLEFIDRAEGAAQYGGIGVLYWDG